MNTSFLFPTTIFRCVSLMIIALFLAACASKQPAPVERRQPQTDDPPVLVNGVPQSRSALPGSSTAVEPSNKTEHVVQQGDTLYSIAMQNDLNPQDVAVWNRINDPSKIAVGQTIRLTPPGSETQTASATTVTTAPLQTVPSVGVPPTTTTTTTQPTTVATTGSVKTSPKAIKEPYSEQRLAAMSSAAAQPTTPATSAATAPPTTAVPTPPTTSTTAVGGLSWMWPTQGSVITRFSDGSGLKGIDIAGNIGQPVVASAAGRVVYVGSGLRGYGNLIILKHNDTYLSVYAHNKEMLVKEGQQIARGQKIAEMGNSDADQVKLHFEIRQDGKPVDPVRFLPAK